MVSRCGAKENSLALATKSLGVGCEYWLAVSGEKRCTAWAGASLHHRNFVNDLPGHQRGPAPGVPVRQYGRNVDEQAHIGTTKNQKTRRLRTGLSKKMEALKMRQGSVMHFSKVQCHFGIPLFLFQSNRLLSIWAERIWGFALSPLKYSTFFSYHHFYSKLL